MDIERQQQRLGDLEGAVLDALWEQGSLTTPAVYDLVGRSRGLAYTTILTVLQRLTKKGLVTRRDDAKAHTYSPALSRDNYHRRRALALAAEVVPLGQAGMAAFLAEAVRLDPEMIASLRKALETDS